MVDWSRIDVIAPNFKRRMSGVTSTVIRLVPLQAQKIGIVTCGPRLPEDIPRVSGRDLLAMPRKPVRVWHARRNSEMLPGLLLKWLLRKRLKLLFTSAAQRDHSGYTKWLIRQMDAVIATSARSGAYLEVPHTVIHHGIDTEAFHPPADKAATRKALNLPEDGTLIGCFGRIRPQKGNDLFVEAMLRVLPQVPDARAVMMGGITDQFREFADGLRAQVADAGLSDRFVFLPEAPDFQIVQYFQALDLYVAPQRWEGFGLTPLEAMACGVPVVATRVGAFEELVEDGETGHLVDIEDVDAMTQATLDLLSDKDTYRKTAAKARDRAAGQFRLQDEADSIIAVYRSLLGR